MVRALVAACWTLLVASAEDFTLTTVELIRKHGYPVETHAVVSQGYILTLHRIPHGREGPGQPVRPPVLVHHALLCSSFDWVVLGPRRALGFVLADAGYDVWLVNFRGNTYSRRHQVLAPSDSRFWDFSTDEPCLHDLPAQIDYILAATGHHQLFYIGHSLGAIAFFATMAQRPEYNRKIRAMAALGPVISAVNNTSPFVMFLKGMAAGPLHELIAGSGVPEILPSRSILNALGTVFCADGAFTQALCVSVLTAVAGPSDQLDKSKLAVILAHTPAGTSTRLLFHLAQGVHTGEFKMFDHGADKNMLLYGRPTPPWYNVSRVTAPVALYYSDSDVIADPRNVELLASRLPNLVVKSRVPHQPFNHLDFAWGTHAHRILHKHVVAFFNKFRSGATA